MSILSACLMLVHLLVVAVTVDASPLGQLQARPVVRMPLHKRQSSNISKRDPFAVPLTNDIVSYEIQLTIGTQSVTVQLDTGSSDLWVLGPNSCTSSTCYGGTYDPSASSTSVNLGVDFEFKYGTAGSDVLGYFVDDTVQLGSATLTGVEVGVATQATNMQRGILGVGLTAGEQEAPTHPTIIDVLYSEGWISSHSYSLYLDDLEAGSGEIIFGGYDSSKWTGDLVMLPIVASPDGAPRLSVDWSSLTITDQGSVQYSSSASSASLPSAALLDSGTTVSLVPNDIFDSLASYFGVAADANGNYPITCDLGSDTTGTVDFGFGSGPQVVVSVPFSELAVNIGGGTCIFGFSPAGSNINILGDTFLRSAYALYDFDTSSIGLAQSAFS